MNDGRAEAYFHTLFLKLYLKLNSNIIIMFNKKGNTTNERVIYQARPNMILGCKKAIFALILLIVVLSVSGSIIHYIGSMQVYLISHIKTSLTKYTAIGIFLIVLIIVIYIIFQIVKWYSKEYILSDSKITVKSGILFTNKDYMHYSAIQDVNTSQSIIARIFNVGSVSVYSAYDNNQISLDYISDPSKIEEIIFSNISNPGFYNRFPNNNMGNSYQNRVEYNDDTITPITHESNYQKSHNYEYYPQDLDNENERRHYEYEPYPNQDFEYNVGGDMSGRNKSHKSYPDDERYYNKVRHDYSYGDNDVGGDMSGRNKSHKSYPDDERYYNKVRHDYSYEDNNYHDDNEPELYYNDADSQDARLRNEDIDESGENLIKRHFDKFKK